MKTLILATLLALSTVSGAAPAGGGLGIPPPGGNVHNGR